MVLKKTKKKQKEESSKSEVTSKSKSKDQKSQRHDKYKLDKSNSKSKNNNSKGIDSSLTSLSSMTSVETAKLTPDQRCRRILKKRDMEHEKAFVLAEKRLRGAIRGQIKEKREISIYPSYH